jgi:hypothetical protein
MDNPVRNVLTFLRARWRWGHGRCPLCNRPDCATFSYHMADHLNCPVCKDETETDLRMWHKDRTSASAKRPTVGGVNE